MLERALGPAVAPGPVRLDGAAGAGARRVNEAAGQRVRVQRQRSLP